MTAGRISARQREREAAERKWRETRTKRDRERPQVSNRADPDRLRAPELIRALQRLLEATGDPVFDDALRAIRAYALDQNGLVRGAKIAHDKTFGKPDQGFLAQMRYNIERKGQSIPVAAEQVAAEFGAPGASFDATIAR